MTYAFIFNESVCTGCKACQAACKDKNNLPLGVLWRRVYEITGGEWIHNGGAWKSTVFAYNLSISCNHCVHPKCAGVCPTDAYEVRPDGIVLINQQKCIGCGYCTWACPYDAPQVDKSAGYITKCNLCYDYLDAGIPPACVSACPMRCLNLVETCDQGMEDMGFVLWEIPGTEHPFPLPKYSRTEPHLVIIPYSGVNHVGEGTIVSNREEISPAPLLETRWNDIPLILFTLMAQMAIGAFGTVFMINLLISDKIVARQITYIPLLGVGVAISIALIVSFFHLGTPKNAWRSLTHMRKSWLSREILFTSGFEGLWAVYSGIRLFYIWSFPFELFVAALAFFCGLAAVYSMHAVYRLRSVPEWNSARTLLEFSISTIGLGSLLTIALLPQEAPLGVAGWSMLAGIIAFSATGPVIVTSQKIDNAIIRKIRTGLLLAFLFGALLFLISPSKAGMGITILIFMCPLVEETIGRWLFYARRIPGI